MVDVMDVCVVLVVLDDVNMLFGLGYVELFIDKMLGLVLVIMMVW